MMGTSTLFKRHNDFGARLSTLSKKELEEIDMLSPWKEEKGVVRGWSAAIELHNGNFHPLIWWYGRLFHLKDAPKILTKKYYNKYTGKMTREYEWTIVKTTIERELKYLDNEFRKTKARERRKGRSVRTKA